MRASYLVRINWSHGKDRSLLKTWFTLLSIANLLPFRWVAYFPAAFITAFASENTRVCISRDARRAPVGTPVACELLSLQLHFKHVLCFVFNSSCCLLLPWVTSFLTAAWQDRLFFLTMFIAYNRNTRESSFNGRIRWKEMGRNGKAWSNFKTYLQKFEFTRIAEAKFSI